MRAEFERAIAGKLPENWHEAVAALKQGIAESKPNIATPRRPASARWRRWCRRRPNWSAARPT